MVATTNGQFLVRRLHHENGVLELRGENEIYNPITLPNGEDIWGVVVGVVRKY